jgi:hypothetical protein
MKKPNDNSLKDIPLKPSDIDDAHNQASDGMAALEAKALGSGKKFQELKEEAEKAAFGRIEKFKEHFDKIILCGLYLSACGAAVFAIIWGLHVILPSECHWLDSTQLETMQNILTGGVLAGLISEQFKKRTTD